MRYKIKPPSSLRAEIQLPASKSISNRALVICALSGGEELPSNLSDCDDTEVMVNALSRMPSTIDIKAAGTAMRFLTAYLSTVSGSRLLTGTDRMKHRPIGILVDALRYIGADIEYAGEKGFPPLRIRGSRLRGGRLEIPGNVSSQYISAILMIGPILREGLELKLTGNIISRPYIDLTLWLINEFGGNAEWTDIDTISVSPQPYKHRSYTIENDWSAASYWYEAMALSGRTDDSIVLTGLMDGSRQGDSIARYLFSLLGVKTIFEKGVGEMGKVRLRNTGRCVTRLEYDFLNAPDLAQTFVTCCALKGVNFHFAGLQTLRIKETDRIEALKKEMARLGYVIKDIDGSDLIWDGERCEPSAPSPDGIAIDTYEDHRMALAFAPLSLKLPGLMINNPQVVTKSYPHFWRELGRAGFAIEEI